MNLYYIRLKTAYFTRAIIASTLICSLIILALLPGCQKDDESPVDHNIPAEIRSVNNFIYENMKYFYLWNEHIPGKLNPNVEPDPEVFFDKMIYKVLDKWSFITDDYERLVNSLQGISKNFGHQYRLFLESDSYKVYGIVEYVIPGSPADSAGLRRGNIFTTINSNRLTIDNYQNLLFGIESYRMGFAEVIDGELIPNGITRELRAVTIAEDPIYLSDILDISGTKIGYLVYMQFIPGFDDALRTVFQEFKSEGINDLVIDLRYNPGGSVSSANLLASLIAPPEIVSQGSVFVKYEWNSEINDYFLDKEGPESENLVLKFITGEVVNNPGMERVFIITTDNTASASELLINALEPYMEVITIGSSTAGKYTASITLHDQEKSYNWAIQPIVLKTANSLGKSDYFNGLIPDYQAEDDYFTDLGTLDEDMLAKAVSLATGIPLDQPARKIVPEKIPGGNSLFSATNEELYKKQKMFVNPPVFH